MNCTNCGKQVPESSKFCPFCGANIKLPEPAGRSTYPALCGPASAGLRLLNFLLDRVILFVFLIIVGWIGQFIFNESLLVWVLGLFYLGGYHLLFEGVWQRTPAKWITKTKVVMIDGSKPDFLHIFGRTLARYIPFEPLSFLAGPVGWHDKLSKTLVVPSEYSSEEVKKINPNVSAKGKMNNIVLIIICSLASIAIIGILATLLLLQLNVARQKARDARRIADVNQIRMAVELYFDDNNGTYPIAIDFVHIGKYVNIVPIDPLTSGSYGYLSGPSDRPTAYVVYAELEQKAAVLFNDSDIKGGDFDGSQETCTEAPNDCIYDQGYIPN